MITDPVLKNKLVLIHGLLMAFVWLFAVPGAVLANMYARKTGQTWGPKVHMIIMAVAAFLPLTISASLAFVVAGKLKPRPHSALGTVITFGAWFQVALGVVNHMVFRYRRRKNCLPNKRPWNNHVHIWLGKCLTLLAFINVGLGLKIKRAPIGVFVVFGLWILSILGAFVYLAWMKETKTDIDTEPDIKTDIKVLDETK